MVCAGLAREAGYSVDRAHHRLQPAPPGRARGGAARSRPARRPAHRPAARPARVRRLGADRRHRRAEGRRRRRHSRSPTCPRATRSSSASRWAWPRRAARATSSSASTRSIIRAIPTAGPSSSPRSSSWRTSRPRPASRATRFTIHAPLLHMTKADIAREAAAARARRRRSATAATIRCPTGAHCGRCDACRLRAQGLRRSGDRGSDGLRMTLRGQGMLPHAAGRGRAGGQPRGVPALCRLQSVVGARAGPRERAVQLLRHRFRRHRRRGRRQVRRRRTSWPRMSKRLWGEGAERAAGRDHRRRADAPARRRRWSTRCTRAAFGIAVETNGTLAGAGRHRLDLRQPQGRDRGRPARGRRAEAGVAAGGDRSRPSSRAGSSTISWSSRWTAPSARQALEAAIRLAMERPKWRLSLQAHKVVGLP